MLWAVFLTAIAIGAVVAGTRISGAGGFPPRLAAAGAGLLAGIALFSMLPEMAEQVGWAAGVGALSGGIGLLWCVDHFLYPICPSCSHSHDHHDCGEPPLHGFGAPLLIATGFHSMLDGWIIRLLASGPLLQSAAPLGLALHKIPEGFALGLITRKAFRSTGRTLFYCALAESLTLLGAVLEPTTNNVALSQFGQYWTTGVLAVTGGSFLYLAYHSLDGSRTKEGAPAAFLIAIVATAGLALAHAHFRLL